ncbi:MAG: hypothetical protein ACE5LU_26695, partial [Anaerolineae bacterium]
MFNLRRFIQPANARWWDRAERELQRLEATRAQGIARRLALLNRALQAGDAQSVDRYREELERFLQAAQTASALPAQVQAVLGPALPVPEEKVPTYWISPATLAEAHAYLTQRLPGTHTSTGLSTSQEPEWMLAVTGLKRDHVYTLEHLIEVKLATQSGARASFDIQDFTRVAVSLHEHGQALHAIFHSHRFQGPPHPSGTDDNLQRILEEGGYPAIQAVFSEDGYVRFFARRRQFAVEVHGKGVKQIDREGRLYRIVHFSTLPHPTSAAQRAGRGDGLR